MYKNVHIIETICIDYNQILHSDKNHQILFMGGPNARIINPRRHTTAILKTVKSQYLSNGSTNRREWEIWHDDDIARMNFTVSQPIHYTYCLS